MKTRARPPAETPAELLNDLRNLVVEAEKMMEDSVAGHSQEAMQAMRERGEAAQERLVDLYEGMKKKAHAGARCTDEAIREHPYQSLAIAAGIGLIAGLLLSRRSR